MGFSSIVGVRTMSQFFSLRLVRRGSTPQPPILSMVMTAADQVSLLVRM